MKDIILPDRAIICGDFNAHHPWWNSIANPIRAETLTTWLSKYNCKLINTPDIVTYTQYSGNTSSVLNLTFATPGVYQSISDWQVNEEATTGSDHEVIQFSISIDQTELVDSPFNAPFNILKANWTGFK